MTTLINPLPLLLVAIKVDTHSTFAVSFASIVPLPPGTARAVAPNSD
jgi:hypothetical protein